MHRLRCSGIFLFFGPIGQTGWRPWPLIGWDIFDFSSETAEWNSMKLNRKQDLKVLFQVCVFGPIRKIKWLPWPLIGWDIFDFSSKTAEQNSTKLARKQDLNSLYQVRVFGSIWKTRWLLASDWLRHFDFSSETAVRNSTKPDRKSHCLVPSLCFSGRLVNKKGRPGWSVQKVAHCTQVHDMGPFGPYCSSFTLHA